MLSRWRKEYREGKIVADKRKMVSKKPKALSENEQIRKFEKHVADVKEENDLPRPTATNQHWAADLTYIRVGKRWLYLAAVIDLYPRRIVGWSLGKQKTVSLTKASLQMALRNRAGPRDARPLLAALCFIGGNEMFEDNLSKETTVKMPAGHLLVVWNILSEKLSSSYLNDEFGEEEKRAIWGLEDLCEKELINQGFSSRPEKEWNELMEKATEFVKTIPVDFLD